MMFPQFAGPLNWGRSLLVAGTRRRIIVKNNAGDKFLEVPVVVGAVVTVVAPMVTGLAAIAALIFKFTLSFEATSSESQQVGVRDPAASRK